ncbi:FAD-dependent oxidoreductase [Candidatus Poribacteria bacterium]|nr:FAD-dependent oxidoreductase [Candidatus Poribacteria bacterium]
MANNEEVKVDVIVIGGGPSGLSAAYTMARSGLDVVVLERGEYAGAKNVSGLLYGSVINELIPEFYNRAPIERPVSKRNLIFLSNGNHCLVSFGSDKWSEPPYNNTFVVSRAQFDRWFAEEASEAGASLLEGVVADGLLYEGDGQNKKVIGVKVRDDEDFYADIVILADGANALVTETAIKELGMRPGKNPQAYALGVKEIIALPQGKIEDRFNLNENEGAALDFIGSPFAGLVGAGFIYTGKEILSLGFVVKVDSIIRNKLRPYDIIDGFKKHPLVKKYVQGGEIVEYSAHLIPEGGYSTIPELIANGLMIVGDAAGLVNISFYHEGSNLAMASGKYAGETAIVAKEKNNFSKQTLAIYKDKLKQGFVMQDLKKYTDAPEILDSNPALFSLYPQKVCKLLVDYFTVSQEPKKEIQKKAIKEFLAGLPKFKLIGDLFRAKKLL